MNWMIAAVVAAAVAGIAGFAAGATVKPALEDRVFELRTYVTLAGRMPALHARFRDHTCKLFEKHGMTNIGYWSPTTGENPENTLIYIIAHASKDAAEKSWKEFQADPDWVKARTESEKDGKIVASVKSVFMTPTEYSQIK
ncbi:MAG TPA: NIPSNAP family protein [Planctomycetota bacterium]|nr:NIPSNAP family protein [Planctomycetota bacterium]